MLKLFTNKTSSLRGFYKLPKKTYDFEWSNRMIDRNKRCVLLVSILNLEVTCLQKCSNVDNNNFIMG